MSTCVLAKNLGLPTVAVLMVLSACGGLDEQAEESEFDSVAVQTYPVTFESYLASFSNDYDPAQNINELADWSGVVTRAIWVDIEEGRFFGESEERPQGLHLNLVFETDQGRRFYVQLPRSFDSSIEQLRSAFPLGSESVIYLQPNNDPLESVWFNTRDDGNEWYFTTPQGWILDHPELGLISPLEYGSSGLFAEASGLDDPTLDEWAPNPKVPEQATDSESRSALADRPNDWVDFPVGQMLDELVGTGSEVPDLIDQLVTDCLGDRGVSTSIIADYEASSAQSSPTQVLGVASGFGSIADPFEPLPSVLPGSGPSQLEVALDGDKGQQGCTQLVQERDDNPVARVLNVLGSDLATLKLDYATDERVRTFWQSWADCMNDRGHDAANLEILRDQFTAAANEIRPANELAQPNQGGVLGILLPEEERQNILDDAAEETETALDELRAREESAASASSQCGADASSTIPQTLASVRIEYEEAMLSASLGKIESLQVEIATFVSNNSDGGR